MNERDWLILHVLYEKRNITKTGQALFISQPALTTRLRQIEEEFGVKLIYSSGKGIHFTSEGEYLAKCAKEMLARMQEIKDQIINMQEGARGTLRIAATHFMTRYKLPRVLKLFKENYPQVDVKVVTVWSKEVLNLVSTQETHIGFIRGDYAWPGKKKLLFEETVCIASTEQISIPELPKLPKISYRTDELAQLLIDSWWRENFNVPPLISMEVDRLDTCMHMVVNGHGYAIMPSTLLLSADDIYKTPLIDKNNQPIMRRTWMIYSGDLKNYAVNAFIEFSDTIDYAKI